VNTALEIVGQLLVEKMLFNFNEELFIVVIGANVDAPLKK
jgi:hypothetical protein